MSVFPLEGLMDYFSFLYSFEFFFFFFLMFNLTDDFLNYYLTRSTQGLSLLTFQRTNNVDITSAL